MQSAHLTQYYLMQLDVFAGTLHNCVLRVQFPCAPRSSVNTTALFFVYCLDCSTCGGFVAMKNAESPRAMFEAIHVHWPTLPWVVVYDNSCHALTYALDCEPEWFRPAQWVIDATHFLGHTGCACAFDIKRQLCVPRLNSQICEQQARGLANCASPLCFVP